MATQAPLTVKPNAGALGTAAIGVIPIGAVVTEDTGLAILPSGISGAESFGVSSIEAGAVISPAPVASEESVGTAALVSGIQPLLPTSITSLEAFGTAVVGSGAATILTSSILTEESIGAAVIATGMVTLLPTGIATQESVPIPALSIGALALSPSGIVTVESFGVVVITGGEIQAVLPANIGMWIEENGAGGQVNEAWMAYMEGQGAVGSTFNERMYDWLGGLGYTGSLTDRVAAWAKTNLN